VVSFADGSDALQAYEERLQHAPFDLVITDIRMPYMNGVELSQKIKAQQPDQPIIVLSAHTDKEYLIELINTGISHFVPKPFAYDTFLQTLFKVTQKIIETKTQTDQNPMLLPLGEHLQWDMEKRLLKRNGKSIELSRNELFLMEILAKNGERITTTQALIEAFYLEGVDINEHGIRNLVLRLRKKLPEEIISTVYGMGYKLLVSEAAQS
jgi:DNA-binding response OmpR family regulator